MKKMLLIENLICKVLKLIQIEILTFLISKMLSWLKRIKRTRNLKIK